MDNNLKLHIVTALDAAGIKATQQQIDGLTNKVSEFNQKSASSVKGFNSSLMKLPGTLGKVAMGVRGIAAAAGPIALIVTVFMEAYEVGKKLHTMLGNLFGDWIPWLKTAEQVQEEQLKKQEEQEKAYAQEVETIKQVAGAQDKLADKKHADIEKHIKDMERETAAYLRQAETISGIKDARDDARVLQMERQKFEEQRYYQSIGDDDAAEQVGKIYDIGIKQLQMEREMQENAMQKLKANETLQDQKLKLKAYQQELGNAQQNLDRAQTKLEKVSMTDRSDKYLNLVDIVDRRSHKVEGIKDKIKELMSQIAQSEGKMDILDIERSNIAMRNGNALAQAAWDYDRSVLTKGDAIGIEFDENWQKELDEIYRKSLETNQGILENTADLAKKIDELLSMK